MQIPLNTNAIIATKYSDGNFSITFVKSQENQLDKTLLNPMEKATCSKTELSAIKKQIKNTKITYHYF